MKKFFKINRIFIVLAFCLPFCKCSCDKKKSDFTTEDSIVAAYIDSLTALPDSTALNKNNTDMSELFFIIDSLKMQNKKNDGDDFLTLIISLGGEGMTGIGVVITSLATFGSEADGLFFWGLFVTLSFICALVAFFIPISMKGLRILLVLLITQLFGILSFGILLKKLDFELMYGYWITLVLIGIQLVLLLSQRHKIKTS